MQFNVSAMMSSMGALVGSMDELTALRQSSQIPDQYLGWNYPPEHEHLVLPFWRNFPAPSRMWHLAFGLIYFILLFSCLIGNGCVIYIFTTSKALRTPSNMFIINLAVFDFSMMASNPLMLLSSYYERPAGWELGCNIYAALGAISGIGSAMNHAVIAFDRYKTISSPIDGRLTSKQAFLLIIFTWLWTAPFTVLPFTRIWGKFLPEGFLTICSFDYISDTEETKIFVGSIFTYAYCTPMSMIILFYYSLFRSVQQHEKMLSDQAKKMNVKTLQSNQDTERNVELRIAKVALTIVFMFICSWTPYAIVALTGVFGNRESLGPFNTMIPSLACKLVSCIDPWVYAFNHPRYRLELSKRCKWLGISGPPNFETKSTTTETAKSEDA